MMPRQFAVLSDQDDLFALPSKLPAGFAYRDDMISSSEEQAMIEQFGKLPFKPFEFHGFLGKRRVVSFGWRYDFSGKLLRSSDAIPPFLLALRQRAAGFAGIAAESLQQVLINEYAPGAGIGWHRDKPMFEEVVGISLGGSCLLRLRRKAAVIGSARHVMSAHARPISCVEFQDRNGSTASRPSINCATR